MAPDLFSAPTHSLLLMLPYAPGTAEMPPNPFDIAASLPTCRCRPHNVALPTTTLLIIALCTFQCL